MSTWKHMHKTRYIGIAVATSEFCYFCKSKMDIIFEKELKHKKYIMSIKIQNILKCAQSVGGGLH